MEKLEIAINDSNGAPTINLIDMFSNHSLFSAFLFIYQIQERD